MTEPTARIAPPPFPTSAGHVDPDDAKLRRIAGDLRLVGFTLAILGLLASFGGAAVGGRTLRGNAILAAGLLILVLPGAWFVAASFMIRGGQGGAIVRWSLRVATIQVAAVVGAGLLAVTGLAGGPARGPSPVVVPAMLLAFFLPAQAALLWQLVRARDVILARDARRGFSMTTPDVAVAEAVAMPADDASDIPTAALGEGAKS